MSKDESLSILRQSALKVLTNVRHPDADPRTIATAMKGTAELVLASEQPTETQAEPRVR